MTNYGQIQYEWDHRSETYDIYFRSTGNIIGFISRFNDNGGQYLFKVLGTPKLTSDVLIDVALLLATLNGTPLGAISPILPQQEYEF